MAFGERISDTVDWIQTKVLLNTFVIQLFDLHFEFIIQCYFTNTQSDEYILSLFMATIVIL